MADSTDPAPEPAPAPSGPGWKAALEAGPSLILPQLAMRRARAVTDRVTAARMVWISFTAMHVVLAAVGLLLVLGGFRSELSVPVVAAVIAALGALSIFARARTAGRSLDDADGDALAASWYARYLREMAIVSTVLPWAFLAGLLSASAVPLLVGLLAAAYNLAAAAPTDRRLERDADAVRDQGCSLDLVEVLRRGGGRSKGRGRNKKGS